MFSCGGGNPTGRENETGADELEGSDLHLAARMCWTLHDTLICVQADVVNIESQCHSKSMDVS